MYDLPRLPDVECATNKYSGIAKLPRPAAPEMPLPSLQGHPAAWRPARAGCSTVTPIEE